MNNINFEALGIITSITIAVFSLVLSIKSYRLKVPRLNITINDKESDCFFGKVRLIGSYNGKRGFTCTTAGIKFRLTNSSPADISVIDIKLKLNREIYRLVDKRNIAWEEVWFQFEDENGELVSAEIGINYGMDGATVPFKVKAYSAIEVIALFHHFPSFIHNTAMVKLIVFTAVGKKSMKVELIEWDKQYRSTDYKDFMQYLKSAKEDAD